MELCTKAAVGLVLRLLRLVVKLVKQHVGGPLALADLPAHVLDLLVGRPAVIRCSHYRWGVHVDIRARRKGRLVAWSAVGPGTPMRDGVTAL